jgi:hypothetical protein
VSAVEILLASFYVYVYVQEMIDIDRYLNRNWHNWSDVITIYGTLPPLVATGLHGICVVKQLELKKKVTALRVPNTSNTRTGPIRLQDGEDNINV